MLMQGFIIMIIGMFVVFVFLWIMVIVMNCMTFIFKFFPEELEINNQNGKNDKIEEIAVIIASAKKFLKK